LYYRDLSTCRLMFGTIILNKLLNTLKEETDLDASGGIGNNRLIAKVACRLHRPRGITVFNQFIIWNKYFQYKFGESSVANRISISDIPGLKGVTGQRLQEAFNIRTMLELQNLPFEKIKNLLGLTVAQQISNWCKGEDSQPVINKQFKETIRCNKPAECKSIYI